MDKHLIDLLRKYNFWDGVSLPEGYPRLDYLRQLTDLMGNNLVKVVLGQRRVGKSHLLRSLIHGLIHSHRIAPHQTLYINKELFDFSFIDSAEVLIEVVATYRKAMNPSDKAYIIIDEIQEINHWEKAVDSLSQDYRFPAEIFITGSNANLLSGELATYIAGRYVTLNVYPFSYEEFLHVIKGTRSKDTLLSYLNEGGLPELYRLPTAESKQNYMQSLLDSIVLRDIVQRNQIRDVDLLKKVIHFATSSIGSLVSIGSIVKKLSTEGYKTNVETIGNYLDYCENAYYLHSCARYDLRGKQILMGEKKYYLNEISFKKLIHSGYEPYIHRLLENAVYLSLLRKGYRVTVGRFHDKEVDFVAEKNNEKLYVQVAYLLSDEKVIEREFGNLLLIADNYPKWVVSLDEVAIPNIEGILHFPVWEMLS